MIDRPPAASPAWAYFLDFDGTLVDIAATPDGVTVTAALKHCLQRLHAAADGALALVTTEKDAMRLPPAWRWCQPHRAQAGTGSDAPRSSPHSEIPPCRTARNGIHAMPRSRNK